MDPAPRPDTVADRRSKAAVWSFVALLGLLACTLILSLDQAELHQPLHWLLPDARH